MVLLILAFSTVLTESQKVVRVSQAKIYANTAAKAIEQVLRDDLRKLTQNGFLSIDNNRLVFTTAGITQSVVGTAEGQASVVTYGRCDNSNDGESGASERDILFRQGWVLDKTTSPRDPDQWETDFSEIQAMDETGMTNLCSDILDDAPSSLAVPPSTTEEVGNVWPAMIANCTDLTIEWFDRKTGTWKSESDPPDADYRPPWTQHDLSNWPKAVKITFQITNPDLPEDFRTSTYEIVCPIGAGM